MGDEIKTSSIQSIGSEATQPTKKTLDAYELGAKVREQFATYAKLDALKAQAEQQNLRVICAEFLPSVLCEQEKLKKQGQQTADALSGGAVLGQPPSSYQQILNPAMTVNGQDNIRAIKPRTTTDRLIENNKIAGARSTLVNSCLPDWVLFAKHGNQRSGLLGSGSHSTLKRADTGRSEYEAVLHKSLEKFRARIKQMRLEGQAIPLPWLITELTFDLRTILLSFNQHLFLVTQAQFGNVPDTLEEKQKAIKPSLKQLYGIWHGFQKDFLLRAEQLPDTLTFFRTFIPAVAKAMETDVKRVCGLAKEKGIMFTHEPDNANEGDFSHCPVEMLTFFQKNTNVEVKRAPAASAGWGATIKQLLHYSSILVTACFNGDCTDEEVEHVQAQAAETPSSSPMRSNYGATRA